MNTDFRLIQIEAPRKKTKRPTGKINWKPLEEPTLRVLSLGAGVQSSALYLMACAGKIMPKPDVAIFSDTGCEPPYVYEYLGYLASKGSHHIPIIRASKGNLMTDILRSKRGHRFATMPLHVRNDEGKHALLRRQCTREYKLEPIEQKVRELLGAQPRQRIKGVAEVWIGISTDEAIRVKPSRNRWMSNYHPLIDLGMSRADCLSWLQSNGYELPQKSSCIVCPYHDNAFWLNLKENHPAEFQQAVEFDREIRSGLKSVDCNAYFHRSLQPLDAIDFASLIGQPEPDQFLGECEGMCGV